MTRLLIALLTAIFAAAETPAEKARNLNDQGNQEAEKANYAEAHRLYGESLAIWRSLGPRFEPHAAGTLLNLAVALSGGGRRQEATIVFEEALALHRRALGPTHLRTLTNMNLLGANYVALGDTEHAEPLLQEALNIGRELYPEDLQTARSLELAANLAIHRGHPNEALEAAGQGLRIAIKSTGEDSLDAALAYSGVAEAHRVAGNTARALPLYRRARFLYEKQLGQDHPRVATLLSQEGLILMRDGDLALAEQAMTAAVKTLRKRCPDCAVELSLAENNLGLLRLKQKRYREADQALTSSVELREKYSVKPGPELAESLQSLAFAREKLHHPDDAARLQARAQTILGYR